MEKGNKKGIAYVSFAAIPNNSSHSIQITKTCEALQSFFNVSLICRDSKKGDINQKYGIKHKFTLRLQKNNEKGYGILRRLNFFIFAFLAIVEGRYDYLYFREPLLYPMLEIASLLSNAKLIFENHRTDRGRGIDKIFREMSIKRSVLVVSITNALQKEYKHLNENNIVIKCSVDERLFDRCFGKKTDLRKELELPENKFLIVYTGSLKEYTGVGDIIELSNNLDSDDICIVIVGGTKKQIDLLRRRVKKNNVIFKGYVEYGEIAKYQQAADVLIAPMRRAGPGGSPTKIFEYLFAKRPIIATDTMTNREEIIPGKTGELYAVGDIMSMKKAVMRLYKDGRLCKEYGERCFNQARENTFEKKALRISRELSKLNKH